MMGNEFRPIIDSIVNLRNRIHNLEVREEPFTLARGGTILDVSGPINVIVWQAPFACTVLFVRGYRVGGTGVTVNARRNGVGQHLVTDLIVAVADTWVDGGLVQDVDYQNGDKLEIMVKAVSGTPSQVAIEVIYKAP